MCSSDLGRRIGYKGNTKIPKHCLSLVSCQEKTPPVMFLCDILLLQIQNQVPLNRLGFFSTHIVVPGIFSMVSVQAKEWAEDLK